MNIFVNSEKKEFSGKNISDLTVALNLVQVTGIALAVNEKVVAKTEWGKFCLQENDKIIIIKATQGG
ncbi:MAG TPA: sulfur carrier protein ThiS [Bacteroidia bacterium]|nr:sulfur carrier protein ThiS [Bacteroidia bacterium]